MGRDKGNMNMPTRKNNPSQQQQRDNFHFISADPTANTDRSRTLHTIRSHAGRWSWQQVRKSQEDAEATDTPVIPERLNDDEDEEDSQITASSTSTTISLTSRRTSASIPASSSVWRGSTSTGRRSRPAVSSDRDSAKANARVSEDSNPSLELAVYEREATVPIENLGATALDPFTTFQDSSFLSSVVDSGNRYGRLCRAPDFSQADLVVIALSVVWPNLMPSSAHRGIHPSAKDWYSLSTSNSTLLIAMLFGSFVHKRTNWLLGRGDFGLADIRMIQMCEVESIRNINRAIQDPSQATSDAVILSVVCLANNRYEERTSQYTDHSPFHAPLRSLQWIDIYGSLFPNPVHEAGLVQLIALRGGLEEIQLPGLAAVISL
jgi:hypothetical protein